MARRPFDDDRPSGDPLIDSETEAARAEVDEFAGRVPDRPRRGEDPAMRPVREAGGGEAEGFELAEEQLVDNAEHGGRLRDPATDSLPPEVESDLIDQDELYGEADRERSTERADERER